MDYSPNGEDCFLASPAFVDLTGQAKAGDVGPKGGMAPHHQLVSEGKQTDLVVDNEARGSGTSLHKGRSQLGL